MEFDDEEYMTLERRTLIADSARKLRRKYLRYAEAEIVYSMTHRKILEMADEAGAIYKFDGYVLINRDILDKYLEKFHQPAGTYSVYTKRRREKENG